MPELRVPELVENPFRELYRGLIVTSMLRSVEEQEALSRDRHQLRRASRYERAAAQLGAAVAEAPVKPVAVPPVAAPLVETVPAPSITAVSVRLDPPSPVAAPAPIVVTERAESAQAFVLPVIAAEPWCGPGIRRAAAAVWVLTMVVLVANTIVLGFDSWATGAADLTLIGLTLVWFATAVVDAGPSSRPSGSQQRR
jgi:hypothetical protein